MQPVALEVIHENQYGFIKGKTIQDCLGWAFEYLHQCHHLNRENITLKHDFEKAFYLIENSAVLAMLHAKGFPPKWLRWIKDLLSTTTSLVLLSGTSGKDFKCLRGVRQGNPLSPLLFAVAADLLQCVINSEYKYGTLLPPFPQRPENPFPIIQYADETILIMQANEDQLDTLKNVLHNITLSCGLVVNFHKSCLVPINVSADKASSFAQIFGCSVSFFPFTYLGLPMRLTKPLVKDYAPLICRIERRMSATSQFLSQAGRLQLVNSVFLSLPTYFMYSLKIPITVIELINKHRKKCLWRGKKFRSKVYNLAAWYFIRMPKDKGGLGVINLSVQNVALLLKQLDKFYRKKNIQWVNLIWQRYYNGIVPHLAREKGSFWWRDILWLHIQYRGVAICNPSMGHTISFWEDIINDVVHSEKYPHLLHFARDPAISLYNLKHAENLTDHFRIPMSTTAFNELLQLQDFLNSLPPTDSNSKDS